MRCGGRLIVKDEDAMPTGKVKIEQLPNGNTVFMLIEVDAAGLPILGGVRKPIILGGGN
jgi:hypothetical protein